MTSTIAELVKRLSELPPDWKVWATRAGGSLEVWEPDGPRYGFVFTSDKPTRMLTSRREQKGAK